ncbi:MAG TPA: organomercurial lyase [Ktedonobacteraceae bacterium]|nr:organomercurial lyase [Ktedonobacteraceae bacterium]
MQHPPLETIVERLSEQLRCEQEALCTQIIHQVARGKPVTPAALQASLQVSQDELEHRLADLPDTEVDPHGNVVGWGVTLVPTRHRFQIDGKLLFTWCAFDTVLFPPSLLAEARVQSTCPVTGHPITFVATSSGTIKNLAPASSIMSLIIPAERSECVRATFCEQSLFFESEQAASTWLTSHPEAIVLSIEEAALVGKLVAGTRFTKKNDQQE